MRADLLAFENRYQEYFEKFDFVGDWGFEQLRLRGFYQISRSQVLGIKPLIS